MAIPTNKKLTESALILAMPEKLQDLSDVRPGTEMEIGFSQLTDEHTIFLAGMVGEIGTAYWQRF